MAAFRIASSGLLSCIGRVLHCQVDFSSSPFGKAINLYSLVYFLNQRHTVYTRMNFIKSAAVFAFCLIIGVACEWEAKTFPRPREEHGACGTWSEPTWVCDPDRILTTRQAEIMNWLVKRIMYNDTECPCSTWQCEKRSRDGYHISIALVKSLKRDRSDSSNNARLKAVQGFAYDLERTRWNYGNCEDDIVIVYVADDRILYTITGSTAQMVLTNYKLTEIQSFVGHYFAPEGDVSAGLYHLLLDIRKVLRGEYISPAVLYGNYEAQRSGTTYVTSSLATVFCLTITSFILLMA